MISYQEMKVKVLNLYQNHKLNWFQILKSKKHEDIYGEYYQSYIHHMKFIENLSNRIKIYCLINDIKSLPRCINGRIIQNPMNKTCDIKGCGCKLSNRDEEKRKQSIQKAIDEGRWGPKNQSKSTTEYWNNFNNDLKDVDILKKKEVIKLLNKYGYSYYGKAGNRICSKDNINLYKSILVMTMCLDKINKLKTKVKFTARLTFLIKYNGKLKNILCFKCKENYVNYDWKEKVFKNINGYMICSSCLRKLSNTEELFILKYGDKGKDIKDQYFKELSKKGNLGIDGFIYRHGEDKGKEKYKSYWSGVLKSRVLPYSKISQKLFWSIYDKLDDIDKEKVKFEELNKEKRLFLSDNEKKILPNKMFICLDFIYKNKIIEYDGIYWHDKDLDSQKDDILKSKGYEILRISSDDFNRNNFNEDIIDECVGFLKNDIC